MGTRIGIFTVLLPLAHLTSPHGSLGGPQAQLPYLGAFSPARSQHALLRVPSSLTATWALCTPLTPHLPLPLSLVVSHRLEEGECHLLGLIDATLLVGGGLGKRQDRLQPSGSGGPLHHKAKALARASADRVSNSYAPPLLCCSDCCDQPCFKNV